MTASNLGSRRFGSRLEKVELYAKDSRLAILSDGTKLPVSPG